MKTLPYSEKAYRLLHDGAITLAEMEANGIAIDMRLLEWKLSHAKVSVARMEKELRETKVMREWVRKFGGKANLRSAQQLGKILFEVMKFEPQGYTETGKYSTDEESISKIDDPFIKAYVDIKKIEKGADFLKRIKAHVVAGILHPVFSLNTTVSFRSSSEDPNFQNIPTRNETMKRMVRKCIVARGKKRRLVEFDFKGVEVSVAACYHKDPRMMDYLRDKSKDMHRDMAMLIFKLPKEEVTKNLRHAAKNKFVFPAFYGDYWKQQAESLWDSIDPGPSGYAKETVSGKSVRKHLARLGITKLGEGEDEPEPGTFQDHVAKVERKFWNDFAIYTAWKKSWFAKYQQKGYFVSKTGFVYLWGKGGLPDRKQVINYAIQGSAFHCLLWSINVLQKEIRKRGMKTLLIAQVHDSLLADVPDNEVEDFINLAHEVMAVRLPKKWKWITAPIDVEVEVCPLGGSWVDKEPVHKKGRKWYYENGKRVA